MVLGCLCGHSDSSRLLDAAKHGDVQVVVSVVQRKPKRAHAQQWGGQTAWHLAAKDGHTAVLQGMADAIRSLPPQQLQQLSRFGSTADEVLQRLAQEEDTKSLTPLHLACIKGHAGAAGALMSLGVNPFVMDSVGRTPLHYAASWGHADCINAVLSAHSGPPKPEWSVAWPNDEETRLVDVQNMAGFTPLHYAVWVGRKEAIQALASYDASIGVVNISHDYDWIKVGSGNTPLHLAAFGGDFDVVKLLLAAHVQTLSAGAEVMTATRGQWGERHADDVRHMRNRRGLMAYHIAVHKGFQHLTELLHPDIPYTFIFSNDDMEVGSVRMYGPARLMVIAAKALQQKLVTELAAVEAAASPPSPSAAAPAAATRKPAAPKSGDKASAGSAAGAPAVLIVAAGGSGDREAEQPAAGQQRLSERQVQEARDAAAAAAAAEPADETLDAAAAAPEGVSVSYEILSPFAARSHKQWASPTPSDGTSLASATPATATPAGSNTAAALSYPVLPAAVAAAVGQSKLAAATGAEDTSSSTAAAAVHDGVSVDSVFAVQAPAGQLCEHEPGIAAVPTLTNIVEVLSPSATAPPALLGAPAQQQQQQQEELDHLSSFTGFAQLQQTAGTAAAATAAAGSSSSLGMPCPFGQPFDVQQQEYASSGASDVRVGDTSGSTVPGSSVAVAGTAADSITASDFAASASARGLASSSNGIHAAAASPSISGSSLPAAEQRASFAFASTDGRASGKRLNSSSRFSRERLSTEESGLRWRPAGNSLVDAHSAAAGGRGSPGGLPGAAAGSSCEGFSRPVHALGGSAADTYRHRRAQSAAVTDATADRERRLMGWQNPRASAEARRATADSYNHHQQQQQQQQPGRSSWLKPMGSLRRVSSRKTVLDDVLPRSIIITTAADDDDSNHLQLQQQQQQQQPAAERNLINTVSNPTNSSRLSAHSSPGFGRRSQDQSDLQHDATRQQHLLLQQQQQDTASNGSSAAVAAGLQQDVAAVSDNPLDVMLTIRAGRIGDSAEAMRQHLLMMKLASGRSNFDTQVSAFNESMQLPNMALDTAGSDAVAGLRVASVTLASPARWGSVAGQGRAAKLAVSQRAASLPVKAQLDEAAATAAAGATLAALAPGDVSAPSAAAANGTALTGAGSGSLLVDAAGSTHSQTSGTDAAAAAAGCGQPPDPRRAISLASLNSSNSMRRSLIMGQPSLQRLLSSSSRTLLSGSPTDASPQSDAQGVPGAATAGWGTGDGSCNGSCSGTASVAAGRSSSGQLDLLPQASGGAADGDLPLIQQQPGSQLQLSKAACSSGLLGSTHGTGASGMITEESDEDELMCEICFDAQAVVVLQACGHALCVGCCREMCKLHHFKPALCPYCRQIIRGFSARVDGDGA